MSERRKLDRNVALIFPRYWASTPNSTFELASERIRLEADGLVAEGTAIARLQMSPQDRVVLSATLDAASVSREIVHHKGNGMRMWFGASGLPCNVIATRSSYGSTGDVSMELIVSSGGFARCRDRRVRLASLLVHVLNFPDFVGLSDGTDDFIYERPDGGSSRLGRVVLRSPVWTIELQATPHTKDIVDALKEQGGNAITHVARLVRFDGRTFSVREAERGRYLLQQFLSFARGLATSVFGATGYDRRGEVVYEEWSNHSSSPWSGRSGWFDIHHGETLAQLFSGFAAAREDSVLGATVSTALYWYLRSNRGGDGAGTDGALVLSQAALEGLAASCLSRAGLPVQGNAAEKIRRGLQHLGIPVGIPKHLRRLAAGKRKGVWSDGPHAITAIRNDLVHAVRRSTIPIGPVIPEAWRLAEWYLELALLRLANYRGVYSNRLAPPPRWVGQVEKVPWS